MLNLIRKILDEMDVLDRTMDHWDWLLMEYRYLMKRNHDERENEMMKSIGGNIKLKNRMNEEIFDGILSKI
jgi:hypothetical protein